jgi:hypothetical protein
MLLLAQLREAYQSVVVIAYAHCHKAIPLLPLRNAFPIPLDKAKRGSINTTATTTKRSW